MAVVAIAALLLGATAWCWRMKLRRDYYLQRARIHAWGERLARVLETPPLILTGGQARSTYGDELSILKRFYRRTVVMAGGRIPPAATLAQYHHELRAIYQDAAARPWNVLQIDSPVPQ
jgi:hypothetical protein